jgi:hypothetical protein
MLLGAEPFKLRFADSAREVCTVIAVDRLRPRRAILSAEVGLRRFARRLPPRLRWFLRRGAGQAMDRLPLARRR